MTVELEHLTKIFSDGTVAVKDLNIDFKDHELSVLVGPSGSGKTTILRLIAGLEEATRGKIVINNRDVTNLPPQDRNVSMVFQNYILYPHMSVWENLGFALRMKGHDKRTIRKQVEKVAKLLHIERHLNKRPGHLSGGEQQRVALGRTIARQADVILLDEPLSNLDANLRVEMRTEIKRLQKDLSLTMIFVTHDQREAMSLGDTMAMIKEGKLQQIGNPLDVYEKPVNLFVASFLGAPPINLVEVRLVKRSNGAELVCRDFHIRVISIDKQKVLPFASKLTLGVRPEDISLCRPGDTPDVTARIVLVENLGNRCHYHLDLGENRIIMIGPPRLMSEGLKNVGLKFDLSKVILFQSESGNQLLRGLQSSHTN